MPSSTSALTTVINVSGGNMKKVKKEENLKRQVWKRMLSRESGGIEAKNTRRTSKVRVKSSSFPVRWRFFLSFSLLFYTFLSHAHMMSMSVWIQNYFCKTYWIPMFCIKRRRETSTLLAFRDSRNEKSRFSLWSSSLLLSLLMHCDRNPCVKEKRGYRVQLPTE